MTHIAGSLSQDRETGTEKNLDLLEGLGPAAFFAATVLILIFSVLLLTAISSR